MQLTFLCLTNEFKGSEFIKACKEAGNRVFVITSESNKDKENNSDGVYKITKTLPAKRSHRPGHGTD